MAEVFVAFLGTQRIELDITSTAANVIQTTRHYMYAQDLVQEIINARVWGGIHYRESDVKGTILGRKVARWALQRYFLPVEAGGSQSDAFGMESLWLICCLGAGGSDS